MGKRLVVVGGAVVAALACTAAAAGASAREFAVGSAKNRVAEFTTFPFQLEVSAQRGVDGDVTGHVRGSGDLNGDLPGGDFKVEGPVTCLRVEPKIEGGVLGRGTRAAIKYIAKTSGGPLAPPIGDIIEVFVEDNGNPRDGAPVDANSTLLPLPPETSNPQTCDDPNVAGQPYNPVDQGDYTLRDDSVAP